MIESTNHIYRFGGMQVDDVVRASADIAEPVRVPTIADLVPVTDIMTRELTSARDDLDAQALVRLMVTNHIGCIPIVDEDARPVGMVTKLDLVEQLLAAWTIGSITGKPATPASARDVMMPVALRLDATATVARAAALMAHEGIHHIPIVDDDGALIGIVSSFDIARWLAANDGLYAPSAR
jgi:CBS domain-containing protein